MGRNNAPIRRCQTPAVKPRVKRLLKVTSATRYVGQIVNDSVWGFWTHWNASRRRTERCVGRSEGCEGCLAELPLKQIGIIELYNPQATASAFVQITPGAWDDLLIRVPRASLRGLQVVISRKPGSDKQPVIIDLVSYDADASHLPAPTDPWTTLARIWGLD
jgi:hypothetical protein